MDLAGGGSRRPVLGGEFHAPEVRARGEEFDAYPGAFVGCVAKIDDAALLFFFGDGIDENQIAADDQRFVEIEKPTMRVDHDCLAIFAELAAFDIFAGGADGDARENPGATALGAFVRFGHSHKQSCNASRRESTPGRGDVPKKHSPSVEIVKGLLKLRRHT